MYVEGGMILSLLAIIVAMGVNYGYRLFKGEVNKSLPLIITVTSVLLIVIATLVVIPLLLLGKEGFAVSLSNLDVLYKNSEFVGSIMKDLLFAVAFTFLGIAGVVNKVKDEVNGVTRKVVITRKDEEGKETL